jgi:hypothetical protein
MGEEHRWTKAVKKVSSEGSLGVTEVRRRLKWQRRKWLFTS